MTSAADPSAAPLELACLAAGPRTCGIDVMQVREIVRGGEATALPGAPDVVEGVVEIRGSFVPVMDLRRLLGLPARTEALAGCIAVVEAEGRIFGLRADRALEVLEVTPGALRAAPPLGAGAASELVFGLLPRPGAAPVLALSPQALLARVRVTPTPNGAVAGGAGP